MATKTAVKEIFAAIPHIKKDVLYISFERPQRATDTDILDDGTFLRRRGKQIVGMTITNISKKFGNINP